MTLVLTCSVLVCIKSSAQQSDVAPVQIIDRYLREGRFNEAVDYADLQLYRNPGNEESRSFILIKKSEIFLETGRPDSARKTLSRASAFFNTKLHIDDRLQFEYYLQQGRINSFNRQFVKALEWLDLARKQLEKLPFHDSICFSRLYREMAYVWFRRLDPAQAAFYYDNALKELAGNSQYEEVTRIVLKAYLATVYLELNEIDKAFELFVTCEDFINAAGTSLPPVLFDACMVIGDKYFNLQDNKYEASRFYDMASAILNTYYGNDYYKYGLLYYGLGRVEYTSDSYEKSLSYFEQALQISYKWPPLYSYRFLCCRWIALYYQRRQETSKAIEYDNLSMQYVEGTYNSLAYTFINLGSTYKTLGDTARAMYYFQKAASEAAKKKSPDNYQMLATSYYELGLLHRQINSLDKAFLYLFKANDELLTETPKGMLMFSIQRELSTCYEKRKEYVNALNFTQKSMIALCNSFNDTSVFANPDIYDTYLNHQMMAAYRQKASNFYSLYEISPGRVDYLEASLQCSDMVVEMFEKIVIGIENESDVLYFMNYTRNYIGGAIDRAYMLYDVTHDNAYADKTLQYAEKSKMLAMRIYLHKELAKKNAGIPDSLLDKEKTIRNQILETGYQLTSAENNRLPASHIEQLRDQLVGLYVAYNTLNKTFEKTYPDYYNMKYNLEDKSVRQLQKTLKNKQVFVEYQIMTASIYLFVVEKNDLKIIKLSLPDDFYSHLETLRTTLAQNPISLDMKQEFKVFVASSRALYNLLIFPIEQYIQGKNLIIAPHNELSLLPFEVLLSKDPVDSRPDFKQLHYLCKNHVIRYVYSGNWILTQQKSRPINRRTAIFLPDYNEIAQNQDTLIERLPVLEGAETEALSVQKIMNGRLFRNLNADEMSFKKEAPEFGILHLAMHAIIDDQIPANSRLALTTHTDTAEDGYLYAYELLQMDLNARLVVLSGCNTGYGMLRKGEGLLSLTRCFFYAGVKTITYSLWPVADLAGSELMDYYYHKLKNYQGPAKAMNTARMKYISNADPVKSHPFYWAGYVVMGDDKALFRFQGFTAIFMVLLTGFIFLVRVRKRRRRYLKS